MMNTAAQILCLVNSWCSHSYAYISVCNNNSVISIVNMQDEGNPTEYSRLGVVNCNHPQQSGIIAITCMHDYRHTQGVQCQLFCVLRSDPSLDLDSVLMRLQQSVNYKLWYTFGLELGVPVNILENLIRYPENECMVEITDYWLRNHPDKPTWSEIENAIKKFGKNAIKRKFLAIVIHIK